jgi:hypothetical protein
MTEFEDQVATRRLATVYCSAVDNGDAELMESLFVGGGQLVVYAPGSKPGVGEPLRHWQELDGFRKLIATLQQSYVRWAHFLGNHWVEVGGDQAIGEAYLMACHLRQSADAQVEEVAIIRYQDSYVRTSSGWRFAQRNACRQWTTVRPVTTTRHEIDAVLQAAGAATIVRDRS